MFKSLYPLGVLLNDVAIFVFLYICCTQVSLAKEILVSDDNLIEQIQVYEHYVEEWLPIFHQHSKEHCSCC